MTFLLVSEEDGNFSLNAAKGVNYRKKVRVELKVLAKSERRKCS